VNAPAEEPTPLFKCLDCRGDFPHPTEEGLCLACQANRTQHDQPEYTYEDYVH
jgi:hypothetical protein